MNSPESYKRRKTIPASNSAATINDLSADLCCIVADFLPKTSRALLAVALTAPPASFRESGWKGQPNAVSQAIISRTKGDMPMDPPLKELFEEVRGLSDQIKEYYCKCHCSGYHWSVLDFIDLRESLAMRLSDDDVGAILVCIDAKSKLERLTLTHCTNVVGHGLEPLRSSTRLQILDLGLRMQFEQSYLAGILACERRDEFLCVDAKLSEEPVCGIVDSILEEKEHSLVRLQYPQKWKPDSDALASLNLYDENVFRSERMKQFVNEHGAIVNKFSCCVYFDDDEEGLRSYLKAFHPSDWLDWWGQVDYCYSCGDYPFGVCSECNDIVCLDCCNTFECEECKIAYCPRCERDNDVDKVTWCEWCDGPNICSSCRSKSCRDGTNACSECRSEMFGELLNECNTKQVQIDSQNDEMKRLRSIIAEQEQPLLANQVQAQQAIKSDGPINVGVMSQTGEVVQFRVKWTTKMRRLFLAYASLKGVDDSDLRFTLRGESILPDATPESLRLASNDLIHVAMFSCNSCGQDNFFRVCSECNGIVCCGCCDTEECDDCKIVHCPRCKRDNNLDKVTWCEAEGYGLDCPPRCSSCRLKSCRDGTNACRWCRSDVFDELLDECNTKQVQIDSQNYELKRLRSIIAKQEQTLQSIQSDGPINVGVMSQTGEVVQFRVQWTTKMSRIFLAYASLKGVDASDLRFTLCGESILSEATPERLGLASNDLIHVAMFSCNSCGQGFFRVCSVCNDIVCCGCCTENATIAARTVVRLHEHS